jgi:ribose transport system ATP-binding protein/inositol transport system ATP-binding protein
MENYLLKAEGISKSFPGVQALQNIHLEIRKGECHALLGANGAGKSTLIKILAGIYQPDEGKIFWEGKEIKIQDVKASRNLGISVIHQELILVPHMTIAENIFMGRELPGKSSLFINENKMNKKADELLKMFDLPLKGSDRVVRLSIAQQQMVEICRALSMDAKLIIMDEPTAALTEKEVKQLFNFIQQLKEKKIAVIFVSHRLEELFTISDRISVFRDGRYVATWETKNADQVELVNSMVGRTVDKFYIREQHTIGGPLLQLRNLEVKGVLHDINLTLHKGEILGLAGLVGAGRTELAETIFGIRHMTGGKILINGTEVVIRKPKDAMKTGICLVPENRKESGLDLIESVGFNTTIEVLSSFIKGCFVNKSREKDLIDTAVKSLSIKISSHRQKAVQLSGGNQQKVVIAKWLARTPSILIMDEPTRGVDVGAKAEIYQIIMDLAKRGVSIIMISSELPEVINIADRIIVMHEGSLAGEVTHEEATQEKIMQYSIGGIHD